MQRCVQARVSEQQAGREGGRGGQPWRTLSFLPPQLLSLVESHVSRREGSRYQERWGHERISMFTEEKRHLRIWWGRQWGERLLCLRASRSCPQLLPGALLDLTGVVRDSKWSQVMTQKKKYIYINVSINALAAEISMYFSVSNWKKLDSRWGKGNIKIGSNWFPLVWLVIITNPH